METSICYDCNKTFKTKFNLQRHIKSTHLHIKSFQCSICLKWFVSKQNVQQHMYIHTQEKPFTCTVEGCAKRFRQISQMRVHRKMHQRRQNRPRRELEPLDLTRLPWPTTREDEVGTHTEVVSLPPIAEERVLSNPKLPLAPALVKLI